MSLIKTGITLKRMLFIKLCFLLCTLVICGALLLMVSNINDEMNKDLNAIRKYNKLIYIQDSDNLSTINTKGCQIPFLKPIDDSVKPFVQYPKDMKPCKKNPLLARNNTHIWIVKENLRFYNVSNYNFDCCYRSFYRPLEVNDVTSSEVDNRVKYNDCKHFTDTINVNDEFVRVTCGSTQTVYDTFFLFAVDKKLRSNDRLIKLRKNLPYNVLVLGIDSVSRLNLYRTMPETVKYLHSLEAVEFPGFNKIGDNTFPNLMAMLLGRKETELKETCLPTPRSTFDNCPFVWELYKEAGFATALGDDTAWMGTFSYAKCGMWPGFIRTPSDYYIHTFIDQAENLAGNNKDRHSFLCMNEQFFYNILLNYIDDLSTTVKTKLFGFFWEATMSHDDLNYPMVMDSSYVNLLTKWKESGYLDETILFFVSDHGTRWGEFRTTKRGRLEERLPFLFVLTPLSFRTNYNAAYRNLQMNSHRLVTPFDIHATLSDLSNLNNIKNQRITSRIVENYAKHRNISLFLPIPENRTCKSADIDAHWCTCHRSVKLSVDTEEARQVAEETVANLNSFVSDYPQCAKLRVEEVLDITRVFFDGEDEVDSPKFTVTLRTEPGGGVFEATLGRSDSSWVLAGPVSRLNLYGNQSRCLNHCQLKLYCYCSN